MWSLRLCRQKRQIVTLLDKSLTICQNEELPDDDYPFRASGRCGQLGQVVLNVYFLIIVCVCEYEKER